MTITIRPELRTHVEVLFEPLNTTSAANAMPEMGRLADSLKDLFPSLDNPDLTLPPDKATLFATAAVEAWHRAVHSFFISCSLTRASPIWASVVGYYSSHYAVRALAHLLGHIVLFEQKLVIKMALQGGAYVCHATRRTSSSREHKHYWLIVRSDATFAPNPLFRENSDIGPVSDAAHRNRANYADHVSNFPQFVALSKRVLKERIQRIGSIEFTAPPIPDRRRFPDLDSVQIVAYHRLIAFRNFVDEILGGGNRFWTVHRDPPWARDYIDYQITEAGGLTDIRDNI